MAAKALRSAGDHVRCCARSLIATSSLRWLRWSGRLLVDGETARQRRRRRRPAAR